MPKIKVIHFNNGSGGGVFSVICNLLKYSANPVIENHVIYTINKDIDNRTIFPKIEGAVSEQVFLYSAKWNFYYTCKQLAKLLPDERTVVIAHDWLELGMMSNLGLQNPVIQFVHGDYDYYYELAVRHQMAVDSFICVAENIEKRLRAQLPQRSDAIVFLRFPVPPVKGVIKERQDNIIFIGRLEEAKGYPMLQNIARTLTDRNIHWHIVGESGGNTAVTNWGENIHVKFYRNLSNAAVLKLLEEMHIILLPSKAEGMPVSIIEAMKAGVIPIVNDIKGGIQELVLDGETGFKIKNNEEIKYVEKILMLLDDQRLSTHLQQKCMRLANSLFDPVKNTLIIEQRVVQVTTRNSVKKKPVKIYGSKLDTMWLHNFLTYSYRRFLKR